MLRLHRFGSLALFGLAWLADPALAATLAPALLLFAALTLGRYPGQRRLIALAVRRRVVLRGPRRLGAARPSAAPVRLSAGVLAFKQARRPPPLAGVLA